MPGQGFFLCSGDDYFQVKAIAYIQVNLETIVFCKRKKAICYRYCNL